MTQELVAFFSQPVFVIVSGISTILVIVTIVTSLILTAKGLTPVLYRLGMGLSRRNIAVFASEDFDSLKDMLVDSGIFKLKNIRKVNKNDIRKAEQYSMFLVHWKDYKDIIGDILAIKKDSTALIIYAPQNEGILEQSDIKLINSHRNIIVVNFRGRLLNDILISLMTTSFNK